MKYQMSLHGIFIYIIIGSSIRSGLAADIATRIRQIEHKSAKAKDLRRTTASKRSCCSRCCSIAFGCTHFNTIRP